MAEKQSLWFRRLYGICFNLFYNSNFLLFTEKIRGMWQSQVKYIFIISGMYDCRKVELLEARPPS